MAQKIVIKVQMSSDRCRPKAMALVAATPGVDSVALAGDAKDQVVVVGDGVDPVKLTSALRRKVGPAQLVQVGDVKKEEKPAAVAAQVIDYHSHPGPGYYYPYQYQYHYTWQPEPVNVAYEKQYDAAAAAGDGYGYACARPDTCSIM